MTEEALLTLSRWQREADQPAGLRGTASALRHAGNTLFSVGVSLDLKFGGPTEHELRSVRSALENASRLLREIEERKL